MFELRYLRLIADKQRKTTLVQYETLSALRSTLVSRIRSRLGADSTLADQVSTKVKDLKKDAQKDLDDWSRKTRESLGIRPKSKKKSKEKKSKKEKKKTMTNAPKRTRHEDDDEKTESKSKRLKVTDENTDTSENEKNEDGKSENENEDEKGGESPKGAPCTPVALESHGSNSDDDGDSSSTTLRMQGKDAPPKKVTTGSVVSSQYAPSNQDDSDLWTNTKFTPDTEKGKPVLSDALVEMLSHDVQEHFKNQAGSCCKIGMFHGVFPQLVIGYRLTRRPVTVVKFHTCYTSMLCKACYSSGGVGWGGVG